MTAAESKHLQKGTRVCWQGDTADRGIITQTSWDAVTITWDNGHVAMGAMICERGQEVPIILDDALVFSDDERIEQMFDALNRAGQKQQVIVLTCRTRTFAALGGRQLSITSGAPLRLTGDQN